MFSKIQLKPLLISLGISLGIGGIGALLAMPSKEVYENLVQPWFAPPSWIFGPVWTVLYILLGIGAYLVYTSCCEQSSKTRAFTFYAVMLGLNLLWTPLFFRLQVYTLAFVEICILLVISLLTTVLFAFCCKKTLWCMIPYTAWLIFATILNRAIATLNP